MKKSKIKFKYIPYDANKYLDNKITESLESFVYNDLVDYDFLYLAGFLAQKYDIDEDVGKN